MSSTHNNQVNTMRLEMSGETTSKPSQGGGTGNSGTKSGNGGTRSGGGKGK